MATQDHTERIDAQLLIDGEFREGQDGGRVDVENPATRDIVGTVAEGTEADAEAAVDTAEDALAEWADRPAPDRADVFHRFADIVEERQDELARLITLEEGKPLEEAGYEASNVHTTIRYFVGETRRMRSSVTPSDQDHKQTYVKREPVGVVGLITPWNFPGMLPMWNLAPALVLGNPVVFKPATTTPLTAFRLVEWLQEAGLPDGVLNFVPGGGATVGEAILQDDRVEAVSFTGSTATGKRVAQLNAQFLRHQVLELGGKNPLIVAEDANLDQAIGAALWSSFSNAGQKCTASSRIVVEEPILEEFRERFVATTEELTVGNGLDEGVEMGPLVDEDGLEKVRKYVGIGKEEGAEVLTGASEFEDDERSTGHFYPPTIFEGHNDMRICQDEIFGPVTTLIPAADIETAYDIANDVRYGLSAAIYTTDLKKGHDAIDELEAGTVFVNQGPVGVEVQVPFGGMKESGYGRELGQAAVDNYTKQKTVYIDYSDEGRYWYLPWD